jgi:hypothetical protein
MKLNPESVVHKISAQASRVTRGEALVVLIEQRSLHRLNDVGTRVWELCDGRSLGEIVGTIVEEFEVEPVQAASEVHAFVEELLGLGALQLPEAAG